MLTAFVGAMCFVLGVLVGAVGFVVAAYRTAKKYNEEKAKVNEKLMEAVAARRAATTPFGRAN